MKALNDLMAQIERREAETARLRNIYYHIQHWIIIGLIKDEETAWAVRTWCEARYPEDSWEECYIKATRRLQK